MKKILLIDPAYLLNSALTNKEFSIGLITIGGYVKRNTQNLFEIKYFMPENDFMVGSKEWLNSLLLDIANYHADIIGCTTRCDTYPFTLELVQKIKSVLPQSLILLGGVQATHTDIQTMKYCHAIDFIIRGEGEITFLELLLYISGKKEMQEIRGITYRKDDGRLIRSPDRESMIKLETFPDYKTIFKSNKKVLINRIEVGRGCPYNCTFCSLCKMWNRRFRLLDATQIIEIMNEIHSINGCMYFVFEHDNLFASKQSSENFLYNLVDAKNPYYWACSSRIDSIQHIDISLLKKAGCKNIFFGIETGSPKMQTIYNKNIDIHTVYETLLLLDENGINFTLSFVCGHPLEMQEDIEKTIALSIQCKTLTHCTGIQIHKLSPLAGSVFLEEMRNYLYLDENSISDQSDNCLFEKYKSIIKDNPSVFSSFYSIPLDYYSETLINAILADGINIINYFSRTLYFILDNKLMQLSELFPYFHAMNLFLNKVEELCNNLNENVLEDIFNFENKIYKCYMEYIRENTSDEIKLQKISYNHSQTIVEVYDYIVNFKVKDYRENLKTKKKVKIRIWADSQSSTIRFSLLNDSQLKNMELCKMGAIVRQMDNSTLSNLIKDGYLTEGGKFYE